MKSVTARDIVRWAPWVIVGVLVLLLALPGFFTVAPIGCEGCHRVRGVISDTTSQTHSANTECTTCHVGTSLPDRARFGFYQAYAMTIPLVSARERGVSRVPDVACTQCHSKLAEVSTSAGLRIRHASCAKGQACTDCHSDVAHGDKLQWPKSYHMDLCLSCHSAKQASAKCESCHVGDLDKSRPSTGPWSITHGKNWEITHGMGDMATCNACHAETFCGKCHGPGVPHTAEFFTAHGAVSKAKSARCEVCHATTFCSNCHGLQMPHPKQFTREHSTFVEKHGDESCTKCHLKEDCTGCHEKHVHPGGAIPRGGATR